MVEKLNLGGLALALCPCSGDFIEFKSPKACLTPKKFSCWIVGVGLVFLLNIL
ncbi:hypothetical protein MWE_0665 [Helicobacter pylori XZ274]|nr:hypothetical protein MWE_0665 [Helicobacter pylori XZ274]